MLRERGRRRRRGQAGPPGPISHGNRTRYCRKWVPKAPSLTGAEENIWRQQGKDSERKGKLGASSEKDRRGIKEADTPLELDMESRFIRLLDFLHRPTGSDARLETRKAPGSDPPVGDSRLKTEKLIDVGTDRVGGGVNALFNSARKSSSISSANNRKGSHINCELRHPEESVAPRGVNVLHQTGSVAVRCGSEGVGRDQHRKLPAQTLDGWGKKSYKEALLHPAIAPRHTNALPTFAKGATKCAAYEERRNFSSKCFRCLGSDHFVINCRDPIRCFRCLGFGHKAFQCILKSQGSSSTMLRAHRARGRAPALRVVVPYMENYFSRRELRQNAILADIVQPANLGCSPIQTIANALADRFGGYPMDFVVARHRDHDYAVILPNWVAADMLVRRRIITLEGFWMNCFEWGQYRHTTPHRLPFKAWIKLFNLPFECWSIPRVATIVGGFGRFLRADENSKSMTNLRAYRCRIAVHELTDIPHNLSLILGDESFPVMVSIDSWEEDTGVDGQPPPLPSPPPGRANDAGDLNQAPANPGREGGQVDRSDVEMADLGAEPAAVGSGSSVNGRRKWREVRCDKLVPRSWVPSQAAPCNGGAGAKAVQGATPANAASSEVCVTRSGKPPSSGWPVLAAPILLAAPDCSDAAVAEPPAVRRALVAGTAAGRVASAATPMASSPSLFESASLLAHLAEELAPYTFWGYFFEFGCLRGLESLCLFQICAGKTLLGSSQDDKGGSSPKVLLLMKLALGIGPLTTSLGMWVDLGDFTPYTAGLAPWSPSRLLGWV
uniref:CCHC-type domain-containing protein n=1 Tax=Ananas comosus var. bracteatus TaxID=296719 RepID=A0A6V7PH34_ANACO|nr:unnamed protein product [Ananas comosus var. bracteatus]